MEDMKRRNFIVLSGLGVTALAFSTWYFKFRTPDPQTLMSEPELLSYIWDGATINAIGQQYRSLNPKEDDKAALTALLQVHVTEDMEQTATNFNAQLTTDFKHGNTLMIDGWILSLTEARQCALFSIIEKQAA